MDVYAPQEERYEFQFMRRDRRFKVPERVEKPRFKAVVFTWGYSYSTYGERLHLEKRLVNFIQTGLTTTTVQRTSIIDSLSTMQKPTRFRLNNFTKSEIGGCSSGLSIDKPIATNEYDPASTNFYGFYFGDGELFDDDAKEIVKILEDHLRPIFNRIGVKKSNRDA